MPSLAFDGGVLTTFANFAVSPKSQGRETEFNGCFLTADKSFGNFLTYFSESV